MELKHRDRIVQIKVVYYGPAVGGKTTNLQLLHAAAKTRHRGEFISVNSAQDRTLLFDILPLRGMGFHKFEMRFQLVAVPGQAQYSATRRLIVRGADAVVFVANSAADRLEENVASVREMAGHLVASGLDPATIPLVFQHNKRDLPKVVSVEELDNALDYRGAPSRPAVAIRGEGVLETLGAILEQTVGHLMGRFPSLALPQGETVQNWTWEMLHQVFGGASIAQPEAPEPPAEGPSEDHRVVRVSVPRSRPADPEALAGVGVPADAAETGPPGQDAAIVERHAQAAMDLGEALERTQEELGVSRRRLEELENTLRAIEAVEEGASSVEALQKALYRIVVGCGVRGATLLGVGSAKSFQFVTGVGLDKDPFLQLSGGDSLVRQRFASLRKPSLVDPDEQPEVARTVAPLKPAVRAALVLVHEAVRNPQAAEPSLEKVARTLEAMVSLTSELAGAPAKPGARPSPER